MIDEAMVAAVAAALVGKVADGLTEAGRAALKRLRRRTSDDPASAVVLSRAQGHPDREAVAALRAVLRRAAVADEAVAGEIVALWQQMPAPRQLPPAPVYWVDRLRELAALEQVLRDNARRRVVLLTGLPGVGKTALAVRCAMSVAGLVPDGQLHVELGGASPNGPLSAGDALGRMLRSLGVPPERVPAAVEEQAGLWRSLTADRRLLLLLDNAVSVAQVRPLLPASPGCVVLVTARTLLAGLVADGAQVLTVRPLDEGSAVAFLERVVGDRRVADDPAAATDLVRACGGVPLALTVTAARLAIRPQWPIRRLLDELAHCRGRLSTLSIRADGDVSMTAAFEASYTGLPALAARCYRLLVLHPGPDFGPAVAAAALQLSGQETVQALTILVDAHLLDELPGDRYTYPNAVRDHAVLHASDDPEQAATILRIIQWYLAVALAADRILTPYRRRTPKFQADLPPVQVQGLAGWDEALDWLELERVNLVEATSAAATFWPELAFRLAYAMWPLFHLRRYHRDREVVDRIAVDCAQRLGDRDYQAAALARHAWGCYDRGRFDQAHQLFARSLVLGEELADPHQLAAALNGLGQVALAQQSPLNAVGVFTRALRLYQQAGDRRRTGLVLVNLGRAQAGKGEVQRAVDTLTEAIEVFADLDSADPYNHARARIELGRVLTHAGEHQRAAAELDTALCQMTERGSPRGQALARWALGELALSLGQCDSAAANLVEAVRLFEELGDREAADARQLFESIERR
ncbi:tetratricopeptide repeat protein [Phytohabitans rumicis]|uniref:NTPase n=1 Tax=Phytohabitans rumicis TaxID=1076125 RepID=A0A6V8LCA5_9ACTN|nr:tetratricopeptide repeat protein [Phytohabitans rumicis]GFJ93270.1 NTPase [Phytohabitans rumicis]